MKALAQGGVDLNQRDANGRTPLHHAAIHNAVPTARTLLKMGNVDVDARDAMGDTPLALAKRAGHAVMARTLQNQGAQSTPEPLARFKTTCCTGYSCVIYEFGRITWQHARWLQYRSWNVVPFL